jgi:protein SSD1
LQIYWSDRDVITWLAENSDDEHLKKVKENAEQHAVKMEVASRSVHDERALFDEDDGDDEIVLGHDNEEAAEEEVESVQREISKARVTPEFEGLKTTTAGHKIQQVKELMTVPVRTSRLLTYHFH